MNITEIDPLQAWNLLQTKANSALIDVRTFAEFDFVGIADLTKINKQPILLPLKHYPEMKSDNQFSDKLIPILQDIFPNHQSNAIDLLFICRSGARSFEAASIMANLGYNCYNVSKGFEGDVNQNYHRGQTNGWKAQNLPWRQN